ncbi:uncharacterized protein BT62DRAFT_1002954 [Guyanagaster necrorhizus]|uniref:Actin cytoskeleton-regulatory complex protein SLA1 n=1 Tax=Guyanagaster necrorhizus TaxID=856835 RepID=A0A9P7VY76_9AGAR|nr:uncharacterized protein BT62DRAFT_1002954 [Guyanagaster necrorhizus MCA 3950]KAG7449383.1 hypothetical protein BT62DRAFT_1002954 [Guyanagaster necrorhizus MCA 3950]
MANDLDKYLAVLKAAYDYTPQSEDEIEIKEDQILFLKERVDDDWWKVKVRGSSQDDDSPVGLVPAAYVEPADHTSVVKAVYDYNAAAPGEISMVEDEILLVFDTEDEWLLVQSKTSDKAGFVPANYVEACSEDTEEEETAAPPQIIVPPSPPRPVSTYVDPADRVASAKVTADDIQTWSVSEVDKKGKKMKGTLGIGNGAMFFASETSKAAVQKWQTGYIVNINTEKSKHVHFDVEGPNPTSLHFSVGSRDNAEAIVSKLESSRALAVEPPKSSEEPEPEPEPAVEGPPKKPSVHFSNHSPVIIPPRPSEPSDDGEPELEAQGSAGVALYDFTAAGDDELSVKEGEQLTIVEMDEEDWWKCRNAKNQEGMVPSSYLDLASKDGSTPPSSRSPEPEPVEEDDAEAREAEERAAAEAAATAAAAAAAQAEARAKREEEKKKEEARRRARIAAEQADAKRKERQASRTVSTPPPSKPSTDSSSSSSRPSADLGRPPADRVRVWHDRTGQFRVDAAFVGMNNGKLRLHKLNGVIVEVPSEKMSHEDMRYVEKLTNKKSRPPTTHKVSEDDIPIGVQYPNAANGKAARVSQGPKKPTVDWFKFFLDAGCDMDDCTRYTTSFERERMDEAVLLDTTEATLRSLGLREGDIIRVMKVVEKRKTKTNGEGEQGRSDEEIAKQLHAELNGSKPAPNIFTGPGGVLKTQVRRGRPQPSKSLPPTTVDLKSIGNAVGNITGAERTASPQLLSPVSSIAVQPPQRVNSAAPVVSGFDDDAWTNRPSSTKPLTPAGQAAVPRAPSAPPLATSAAPTNLPAPSQPPPSITATSTGHTLAKTTESDIFDQLSRLSELRKNSPSAPQPTPTPPVVVASPVSYGSGLGMGSSPAPIGQHLQNQQTGMLPQPKPPQPYNGPRGPFAPVPANQGLLQPLIPTQTGFNSFIPTRSTGASVSPFVNNSSPPSLLTSQPTGFPSQQAQIISQPTGFPGIQQPIMSQPTGMPFGGFNGGSPFQNGGMGGVMSNPTGMNSGFGQFGNGMSSPPPVPPLPNANNTNPANIFAQMKSGTFAQDNEPRPASSFDALRTNPIQAQPTGWGGFGGPSYIGYQR